jgi:hypothetical protein
MSPVLTNCIQEVSAWHYNPPLWAANLADQFNNIWVWKLTSMASRKLVYTAL